MNKFEAASRNERTLLREFLLTRGIENVNFTGDTSYERYDGTYRNSKGENIIFEVKVRSISSTNFKTSIIEKPKYDFLLREADRLNAIPFVFIFYIDNKVLVQNLLDSSCIKKNIVKEAPKTTMGDRYKKIKTFIEIPITTYNTYNFKIKRDE